MLIFITLTCLLKNQIYALLILFSYGILLLWLILLTIINVFNQCNQVVLPRWPNICLQAKLRTRPLYNLYPFNTCREQWLFNVPNKKIKIIRPKATICLKTVQVIQNVKYKYPYSSKRGGHLVHIESSKQQQKIYDVVRQYQHDHVWIGINDRATEEHFVWSSGKCPWHLQQLQSNNSLI